MCQVCLKRNVCFLHVSGMLEKKCFFLLVSGLLEKICVFLRVSGLLEKKWVFCVCHVCLIRNAFFVCVRYV